MILPNELLFGGGVGGRCLRGRSPHVGWAASLGPNEATRSIGPLWPATAPGAYSRPLTPASPHGRQAASAPKKRSALTRVLFAAQ